MMSVVYFFSLLESGTLLAGDHKPVKVITISSLFELAKEAHRAVTGEYSIDKIIYKSFFLYHDVFVDLKVVFFVSW